MIVVAIATYCFWTSLYFYVPILPLHARELGAGLGMVGLVIASYAIGQILLRIPIGIGSDIFGRKPFAVGSLLVSALAAIGIGIAPNPWSLFAARTLTGISAAGWVAISVLFSSYYQSGNTVKAMAMILTVNSLSLVTATFIGGITADYFGNVSTFYIAAIIAFIGALLLLTIPEPRISDTVQYSIHSLLGVIRSSLLLRVSVIAITFQFVTFGVSFGFLPVHVESLGASKSVVGYITTIGLIATVVGTATSAWMVRRWGSTSTVLIAVIATLCSLILMTVTTSLAALGFLQILNGYARGLTNTVLISLALDSAPAALRATAMGSFQALYAIGMLAGPALSGPIADTFGIEMVFWISAVVTALGGLLVLIKPLPSQRF